MSVTVVECRMCQARFKVVASRETKLTCKRCANPIHTGERRRTSDVTGPRETVRGLTAVGIATRRPGRQVVTVVGAAVAFLVIAGVLVLLM